MKKIIIVTFVLLTVFCIESMAKNPYANPNRVQVNGYYRKDGTYVQSHQRTVPNNTKADNLNYGY